VRLLRSIVESFVLAMLAVGQHLSLRRSITLQFIRHHHPWSKSLLFEQFAEKLFGCCFVPMPLHQDVEHVTVCVHCLPQVILLAVDFQFDFI
jgi:hypothetical protein